MLMPRNVSRERRRFFFGVAEVGEVPFSMGTTSFLFSSEDTLAGGREESCVD